MNTQSNNSNTPQIIGRYEVINKLGEGGMAMVYLARDPLSQREVAIKVVHENFTNDREFRRRFREEIKLVAGLEHNAIVPVYDLGEQEGKPFLVMRHMPGRSLRHRMFQEPSISIENICFIAQRVADALEKAHTQGVIHRDIKPANVLFDDDGSPYLSDFGIAHVLEQTTSTDYQARRSGSPPYMAPEQWNGKKLSLQTDVYQLGVMFFELLTGTLPYQGDDLRKQHSEGKIPSAKSLSPELPIECDRVLQKAMAKNSLQRHETPKSFAEDLVSALNPVRINGRYELKQKLSEGRLADVFLAQDLQTGKEVTLKKLAKPLLQRDFAKRQFKQKIQKLTLLKHKNILNILDVDLHEGKPFIVTNLLPRSMLKDKTRANEPLDVNEVLKIAEPIAAAIDAAHQQGVLHLDLRPSNIMFDNQDVPYLADSGVLDICELTDTDDDILYSPYYRAPEQWNADGLTTATDIYQFANLLFELLTGQRPFLGENNAELKRQHISHPLPSAHKLNPQLPPSFDAVLEKALKKNPASRTQSATEIVAALATKQQEFIINSLFEDGRTHYRQSFWHDAIDKFERVVDLDENHEDAKRYLARARERKQKEDRYKRGKQDYENKRWQEAIFQFEKIPGYRDADSLLTNAERNIHLESLYKSGQTALETNKFVEAHFTFVQIEDLMPNYKDVDELIRKAEERIKLHLTKARDASSQKEWQKAIEYLLPIKENGEAKELLQSAQKHVERRKVQPNINLKNKIFFGKFNRILLFALVLATVTVVCFFAFYRAGFPPSLSDEVTFAELQECIESANPVLEVSSENGESKFVGPNQSIRLQPREQVDILLTIGASDCSDIEERVTYVWQNLLPGHLVAVDGRNRVQYLAPPDSAIDSITVEIEIEENSFSRSFSFPVRVNSDDEQ